MLHSLSPHPVQCFTVGNCTLEQLCFTKLNFDHVRNVILWLSSLDMLGAKLANIISDVTL